MKCMSCGGLVIWKGHWMNMDHTECQSCGAINNETEGGKPYFYCIVCREGVELNAGIPDMYNKSTQVVLCPKCGATYDMHIFIAKTAQESLGFIENPQIKRDREESE